MGQKEGSKTKYMIVIQEGNDCYTKFDDYIKSLNARFYAYIRHTADEDHNNNHIHLVIDFGNGYGKTLEEIHTIFKGCHEEYVNRIDSCCAYLTHETPTAKEQKKKLYNRTCVVTNDFQLYNAYANKGSLEVFDTCMLELYIEQGTDTYIRFCQRFGIEACQPYMISIKEYLTHFDAMQKVKHNNEAIVKLNLIYQVINGQYMSDHDKVLKIEELFLHGILK